MSDSGKRVRKKEPVTIRLDVDARAKLQDIAQNEERTVSSLIDSAVREFLDRRSGRSSVDTALWPKLKVRHASLPDTCVLHAYRDLAFDRHLNELAVQGVTELDFVDDGVEWRRLIHEVLSGGVDLIESMNWLTLFLERKQYASPRLDWIAPYLQLFVGHSVFVRQDHVVDYLGDAEVESFLQFQQEARTGRELSLRSLVVWSKRDPSKKADRVAALESLWGDAIACCQMGTDYQIAVRRVAPVLAGLLDKNHKDGMPVREPAIQGVDSLDSGYLQFQNGTVSAFIGNLLQTADLLVTPSTGLLLAGPSDLRIPSINTLVGPIGFFDQSGKLADGSSGSVGESVRELWARAAPWFRDDVVMADSGEMMAKFLSEFFPEFASRAKDSSELGTLTAFEVFRSLMQTWVKWFADPDEARVFVGGGDEAADSLVRQYEMLCERLHPGASMTPPGSDLPPGDPELPWRFPVFTGRQHEVSKG